MKTTFLHRLRFCFWLLVAWNHRPHLRFGQLVANYTRKMHSLRTGQYECDPYYLPDEKFIDECRRDS